MTHVERCPSPAIRSWVARRFQAARVRPSGVAVAAALLVAAGTLAGCGGDSGGPPTLTWYINPDSGGQEEIASRCTDEAGGDYVIEVSQLPHDSPSQRERRSAGWRRGRLDRHHEPRPALHSRVRAGRVPRAGARRRRGAGLEGVVESAIEGSTWDDKLVAIPFWANTQLLWYRKSVAEAARLDMEQPVTWDQIIEAAQSEDKLIGAQGIRSESLTVWLNALVESAGGHIIEKVAESPEDYEFGLTSDAGIRAAEVMRDVSNSGQVGGGFSTANEDSNATGFESDDAGFMVNWPFVWPRANSAVEAGTLDQSVPDDYGWTLYPRVDEGTPSAPPYGGINLTVGAFSKHVDFAYEATECITSDENQAYYFETNGNPAASIAVYDDPKVLETFPQAPVIRGPQTNAAPRPLTPTTARSPAASSASTTHKFGRSPVHPAAGHRPDHCRTQGRPAAA